MAYWLKGVFIIWNILLGILLLICAIYYKNDEKIRNEKWRTGNEMVTVIGVMSFAALVLSIRGFHRLGFT